MQAECPQPHCLNPQKMCRKQRANWAPSGLYLPSSPESKDWAVQSHARDSLWVLLVYIQVVETRLITNCLPLPDLQNHGGFDKGKRTSPDTRFSSSVSKHITIQKLFKCLMRFYSDRKVISIPPLSLDVPHWILEIHLKNFSRPRPFPLTMKLTTFSKWDSVWSCVSL